MADTTYSRKDLLALGANQKALAEKAVVKQIAKMLSEHNYNVMTGPKGGFFSFGFEFTIHTPFILSKDHVWEAVMSSELFKVDTCFIHDQAHNEKTNSISISLTLAVKDQE